jgi:hypothetical protein
MMDEYRLTGWQPKTDKIQSCNYRRNILQEKFKFMEKDVTVLLCNFNKHVFIWGVSKPFF